MHSKVSMRRALASARFDSNDTRHPQTYDEGSEQGAAVRDVSIKFVSAKRFVTSCRPGLRHRYGPSQIGTSVMQVRAREACYWDTTWTDRPRSVEVRGGASATMRERVRLTASTIWAV